MQARGFLQVVPERNTAGRTKGLKIARVTGRCPRDPLPGAFVVQVVLDMPDEIANIQTATAAVKAGMVTLVLEPPEPAT